MSELATAITTGTMAFTVTNIDDIVLLTLFFSQVNANFRRQHIVIGQYLGFTALVAASLLGFFGGLVLPQPQIGLLGLAPIMIGLGNLLNPEENLEEVSEVKPEEQSDFSILNIFSPQAYSVAVVTVANGGDNISIYVPLFASCSLAKLLVILSVFFLLTGVWCYTAYLLTSQPTIAHALTRYGSPLVPYVLIGLGVFIAWESHTLENQALRLLFVLIIGLYWLDLARVGQTSEEEK